MHFVHKFQDKDPDIYFEYKLCLMGSLSLAYIPDDILHTDFQYSPADIGRRQHCSALGTQHSIHMDSVYMA